MIVNSKEINYNTSGKKLLKEKNKKIQRNLIFCVSFFSIYNIVFTTKSKIDHLKYLLIPYFYVRISSINI